MPTVKLRNRAVLDVEGFPADAKRSCVGALRLTQGVRTHVTKDEADYLVACALPVVVFPDPEPPPSPPPPTETVPSAPKKKRSTRKRK